MQYRAFGKLGWKISSIGFGAWAIGGWWGPQDDDASLRALHRAFDLGCNFVDTARVYGNGRSEKLIGQALRDRRGEHVYVASKIPPASPGDWPPSPYDRVEDRFPARHIETELDNSLRDLGADSLDLMQIHTWSRAWNDVPKPFEQLARYKRQGKIRAVGVSTPEQDQHAVVDLMRAGLIDSVQLICNIFEQDPAMQLLPLAQKHGVAVIVRVALEEGALTGKLTPQTKFPEGDMRNRYFAGDRLARTVERVERIRKIVGTREPSLAVAALKFALKPEAVSTVIPGIRNEEQAALNCAVSDMPPLDDDLEAELRKHYWRRAFWYAGK